MGQEEDKTQKRCSSKTYNTTAVRLFKSFIQHPPNPDHRPPTRTVRVVIGSAGLRCLPLQLLAVMREDAAARSVQSRALKVLS